MVFSRSQSGNMSYAHVSRAARHVTNQAFGSPKRTGFSAAGIFLLVGFASSVTAALNTSPGSTQFAEVSNTERSSAIELELTPKPEPTSSAAPTAASDANHTQPSGSNSSTVSMNISSETTNGVTHTEATVNGQPIEVPNNNSTQQTVTSTDGTQTTVSVSSSNTGSGTGFNSSFTNVHSFSNAFQQGGQ